MTRSFLSALLAASLLASPVLAQQTTVPAPQTLYPVTNAWTAANTYSFTPGASQSAITVSGAPYTAGTATTNFPLVYLNDGAAVTTFSTAGTVLGINAPNGFTGNMVDFHVNGATGIFTVGYNGQVSASSTIGTCGGCAFTLYSRGILTSPAAGQWQLGNLDAASPVAQTLNPQNVVAGTSNTAGANWTFDGSIGTGSGAGGSLIFKTAGTGAGATVQNSLYTALTIAGAVGSTPGVATFAVTPNLAVPTYVSGNWYGPPFIPTANGSAVTAGTIYAQPFVLFSPITIAQLGVRITTVGSSNTQAALYANSGGYPTGAALCATGNIANTGASSVGAVCAGGNVTLQPGLYWMETNTNDSTMICQAPASSGSSPTTWFAGNSSLAITQGGEIKQTATFGTWPTESSSGWTETNGSTHVCVAYMLEN